MENKFKITSKLEKSLDDVKLEDDGSLILEGIASTTSMDLEGDTISRDCINSMKSQALSCNIHGDHMIGLDDVIGTVKDVLKSGWFIFSSIDSIMFFSDEDCLSMFLLEGLDKNLKIRVELR